jgi:hypothetical protein
MANPTWGLLAKSATDNETIEEAIVRLIQAHDDDEESHLDVGQSLQSHKASEIIDHLAESIIFDKLSKFSVDFQKFVGNEILMMSCFESVDNWNDKAASAGGVVGFNLLWLTMSTDDVTNDVIQLGTKAPGGAYFLDFTKGMLFQTTAHFANNTNQLGYIKLGNAKYFGFKVVDGKIYSVWKNAGAETATELVGYASDTGHTFRAEYDETSHDILYYIDGVLVDTQVSDFDDEQDDGCMYYYLKTTANEHKNIDLHDVLVALKRT